MKNKVIKLTENDITKIVEKLIKEGDETPAPPPSPEATDKYIKLYKNFQSIDHKLADIINWLHVNFGLGIDSEDAFLKSSGEEGHKLMSLMRKGKEITSKLVKNQHGELLNVLSAEEKVKTAPTQTMKPAPAPPKPAPTPTV